MPLRHDRTMQVTPLGVRGRTGRRSRCVARGQQTAQVLPVGLPDGTPYLWFMLKCYPKMPHNPWPVKRLRAARAARRLTAIRYISRLKPWAFSDFHCKIGARGAISRGWSWGWARRPCDRSRARALGLPGPRARASTGVSGHVCAPCRCVENRWRAPTWASRTAGAHRHGR
jgi:hypothetical protein